MKNPIIIIISIVVVIALMATGFGFAEISEKGAASETHPGVPSEEMEKKEDIALVKYNKLLAFWAKEPGYVDDNDAAFPDFFGGTYIDDNKNLVIQVTSDEEYVIDYFKRVIDLDDTCFEKVQYPYSELIAVNNQITSIMNQKTDDELIASIIGTGIRVRDNAVSIHFSGDVMGERETELRKAVHEKITDFPGVVFVDGSGKSIRVAENLKVK